jgi:hypothetical protein
MHSNFLFSQINISQKIITKICADPSQILHRHIPTATTLYSSKKKVEYYRELANFAADAYRAHPLRDACFSCSTENHAASLLYQGLVLAFSV